MTEFTKIYTKVCIGDTSFRHKVRIEDNVETEKGSVEARIRYFRILDTLVTTPDLATVGPMPVADSSTLRHDGIRWILEMEAVSSGDQ